MDSWDLDTDSGAVFSSDNHYRYCLWRCWEPDKDKALFIGLNPSTADASKNDPTIRRCISFAQGWGYGGVIVANLFAYKATYPTDLLKAKDPVGPDNNIWLSRLSKDAGITVACWGNHGQHQDRNHTVKQLLGDLHCLKINQSGEPAHPLYQPKSATPVLIKQ